MKIKKICRYKTVGTSSFGDVIDIQYWGHGFQIWKELKKYAGSAYRWIVVHYENGGYFAYDDEKSYNDLKNCFLYIRHKLDTPGRVTHGAGSAPVKWRNNVDFGSSADLENEEPGISRQRARYASIANWNNNKGW